MKKEPSESGTAQSVDIHSLLVECLKELGGREFVLSWAKDNPSDFMRILASYVTRPELSAPARPELPAVASPPIAQEVVTQLMEVNTSTVGAFDRRAAAEYLSISVRLLDDLLSAGEMRRVKLGRKTLIRKVDLDNYLEKLANG